MTLVAGTYQRKAAEEEIKSTSGEVIAPGETYFFNEEAGDILTLNEGEVELLGLRDFTTAQRKELAKKGYAMKDGSYPIENCQDAANAIHRIGTGKASPAAIKQHIGKRVAQLKCTGSEFDNFI